MQGFLTRLVSLGPLFVEVEDAAGVALHDGLAVLLGHRGVVHPLNMADLVASATLCGCGVSILRESRTKAH